MRQSAPPSRAGAGSCRAGDRTPDPRLQATLQATLLVGPATDERPSTLAHALLSGAAFAAAALATRSPNTAHTTTKARRTRHIAVGKLPHRRRRAHRPRGREDQPVTAGGGGCGGQRGWSAGPAAAPRRRRNLGRASWSHCAVRCGQLAARASPAASSRSRSSASNSGDGSNVSSPGSSSASPGRTASRTVRSFGRGPPRTASAPPPRPGRARAASTPPTRR